MLGRRVDGRAHDRCGSRSTTATASPASCSIDARATRPRASTATSRAGTRCPTGCATAAWRASSPRTATRDVPEAWRDTVIRCCTSGSPRTSIRTRSPTRCAPCRARARSRLGELGELDLPCVVVASRDEADPGHPYAVGERYAEEIPGAELRSEEPGASPLAWQGGQLSKVIAGIAGPARGALAPRPCLHRRRESERLHPRHQRQRALDHRVAVVGDGERPLVAVGLAHHEQAAKSGASATSVPVPRSGSSGASAPPRTPRAVERRRRRSARRRTRRAPRAGRSASSAAGPSARRRARRAPSPSRPARRPGRRARRRRGRERAVAARGRRQFVTRSHGVGPNGSPAPPGSRSGRPAGGSGSGSAAGRAEQVALAERRAERARGGELLLGVDPLRQHRRVAALAPRRRRR